MLLALWFDFWNSADWVPAPIPPPPPAPPMTQAGHSKKPVHMPDYYEARPDHEFWDAREAMMRRFMPVPKEVVRPTAAAQQKVKRLNAMIEAIPQMPDMARLRKLEGAIEILALQIEKLRLDSDEEAILVLLLS